MGIRLSNEAELIRFSFDSTLLIIENVIDTINRTISFTVESGTDISNLTPRIEISEHASITPVAGVPQDFSNPVVYTITLEHGLSSVAWTILFDFVSSVWQDLRANLSIYPNPAN